MLFVFPFFKKDELRNAHILSSPYVLTEKPECGLKVAVLNF